MRRLAVLTLALACAAATPTTGAQTAHAQREARRLFQLGLRHHDRGRAAQALEAFEAAERHIARPSIAFNIGVALQALGRIDAAWERFHAVRDALGADSSLGRDAQRLIASLEARAAVLSVTTASASTEVRIDALALGARRRVLVAPGAHQVEVRDPGHAPRTLTVTVEAGSVRALALDPEAEPPAAPPPPSPLTVAVAVEVSPPNAALRLDGVLHPAGPLALAPGVVSLAASAPGYGPLEGVLVLRTPTRLRVSLAPAPAPRSRALAWATVGAAAGLSASSALAGLLAIDAHATFSSRTQSDPDVDALARRGRTLSIAADVLGALALGAALWSLYEWLRPTPPAPRSRFTAETLDTEVAPRETAR